MAHDNYNFLIPLSDWIFGTSETKLPSLRRDVRIPITLQAQVLSKNVNVLDVSRGGLRIACDDEELLKNKNDVRMRVFLDTERFLDLNVKPVWSENNFTGLQILEVFQFSADWEEFVDSRP